MKHFLIILMCLLLSTSAFSSYADEPTPPDPEDPEVLEVRLPKKKNPLPPGIILMPSNQYVGFKYASGIGIFTFPADVEYIDIEAEHLSTHTVYVGSASVDYPIWQQTLPAGEYIITCTADTGDIFEGYVYI